MLGLLYAFNSALFVAWRASEMLGGKSSLFFQKTEKAGVCLSEKRAGENANKTFPHGDDGFFRRNRGDEDRDSTSELIG